MEDRVSDNSLTFVEMFEAAEQASDTARQVSERCRDYFDNKQWTEEEAQTLRKRGQAPLVDNVIAGKVNWLIGQEMNSRTDPKAFPRTPQHQQGAEAATDAIRYVCDNAEWPAKRSAVWENMLIEGFGGVEVTHVMKRGEPEIVVNHYAWDRLFYDPHSRMDDFSDATYLGAVIWADKDKTAKKYPKMADALTGVVNEYGSFGETYEDRPRYELWGDRERNRIRCVLMYYLEDSKWKWVKFTKGVILEEGESPYVDEDGESVCPLILQSAYIDRENRRYGEVLKMLDQQDEINKRRSKALHLLTSRQTIGVKGALDSVAAMKREMAKPDGHVEVNIEAFEDAGRVGMRPFEVQQTGDLALGQFQLLQEAKQSLQNMGATEALMGAADGESGRAVLAKQQGAMQGITPLVDKLKRFTRRVFEAIWQRIRQLWTAPKWIRVTDDERNVRFVGLNQPVTVQDFLSQQPEEDVRAFVQSRGIGPGDPRLTQVIGRQNMVEEMEVDIILEEVPDTVTLEAETFQQLVDIDTARGGILPLELIIEASPLRTDKKQKILDWLDQQKQGQGQAGQMQQQMAQLQAQMAQMQAEAEMRSKAASAQRDMATAEKTLADADKIRAETAETVADTRKTLVETQRLALGY
jgi:hypothetical protein